MVLVRNISPGGERGPRPLPSSWPPESCKCLTIVKPSWKQLPWEPGTDNPPGQSPATQSRAEQQAEGKQVGLCVASVHSVSCLSLVFVPHCCQVPGEGRRRSCPVGVWRFCFTLPWRKRFWGGRGKPLFFTVVPVFLWGNLPS